LYHMYALERYQSFRELAENIKDDEPKWYDEGVRHLSRTQSPQGTWETQAGAAVDTAFGALFLMRSTKKSIQKSLKKFGDGQLSGGRGLPTNAAEVTVKQGKVVSAAAASAKIEDLVTMLEEGEGSKFEYLVNNPEEFKLSDDETLRRDQLLRLRRLVTASTFETRLVAVRGLSRARDFESVPSLIFALSDPDPRVVREAESGLRFIARKFGPSQLPLRFSEQDQQAVVRDWTKWYAAVKPDVELPR
ncbi:MAG TPA: HEAT repeat domain-containing protein, partial [Pirellulaceae bacterium]|nr:HEAT repeat domain-containing protein [Pirellulaceae bacterium]